ncbi:hypothetical protein GCM10011410_05050 [Hoyosella rhizosphaerae]|uniref:Uncharacterized protein n=2 Tax=Hoyosella rhizosphaerae TaxID=1755582 RepID=A0A916X9T3_9ACTN|nr:hypothetical protein GCM10011410_05050 [Hoyosella rhizosphaerae]
MHDYIEVARTIGAVLLGFSIVISIVIAIAAHQGRKRARIFVTIFAVLAIPASALVAPLALCVGTGLVAAAMLWLPGHHAYVRAVAARKQQTPKGPAPSYQLRG